MANILNRFMLHYRIGSKKNLFVIFIILAISLLICGYYSEDKKFQQLSKQFIKQNLSSQPALATTYGIHDFDGQLDDISNTALENQVNQLETCLNKLTLINPKKLSSKHFAEYLLLTNQIENRLIDLRDIKLWQKDPVVFIESLGNSFFWLLNYREADWGFRLQNILQRLSQVPRYIQQIRDYVIAPTPIHINVAVEQTKGLIEFIKKDLSGSFHQVPALEDTLKKVSREAIKSLEAYHKYLMKDLLPHSSEHFRLGELIFQKKIQVYCDSQVTSEKILELADQELQNIRNEIMSIAGEIRKRHFSKRRYAANIDGFNEKLVSDAMKAAQRRRLSTDELLSFLENELSDATRFVTIKELADFELNVPIKFEIMPSYLFNHIPVKVMPPNLRLESGTPVGHFTFFINPGSPRWNWRHKLDYYKAYNKEMLRVYVLGYLMPGTYLQYNELGKNHSDLQYLFGNPLIKAGWQVFSPYILRKNGYTGYDPIFVLMQLKYTLNCVLNAIVDVKIHTTDFSEQAAKQLFEKVGYMNQAEIDLHWRQICLRPTEHAIKFLGYITLMQLQAECRRKDGNLFSQRQFNIKVLKSGFIPIQLIHNNLLVSK